MKAYRLLSPDDPEFPEGLDTTPPGELKREALLEAMREGEDEEPTVTEAFDREFNRIFGIKP